MKKYFLFVVIVTFGILVSCNPFEPLVLFEKNITGSFDFSKGIFLLADDIETPTKTRVVYSDGQVLFPERAPVYTISGFVNNSLGVFGRFSESLLGNANKKEVRNNFALLIDINKMNPNFKSMNFLTEKNDFFWSMQEANLFAVFTKGNENNSNDTNLRFFDTEKGSERLTISNVTPSFLKKVYLYEEDSIHRIVVLGKDNSSSVRPTLKVAGQNFTQNLQNEKITFIFYNDITIAQGSGDENSVLNGLSNDEEILDFLIPPVVLGQNPISCASLKLDVDEDTCSLKENRNINGNNNIPELSSLANYRVMFVLTRDNSGASSKLNIRFIYFQEDHFAITNTNQPDILNNLAVVEGGVVSLDNSENVVPFYEGSLKGDMMVFETTQSGSTLVVFAKKDSGETVVFPILFQGENVDSKSALVVSGILNQDETDETKINGNFTIDRNTNYTFSKFSRRVKNNAITMAFAIEADRDAYAVSYALSKNSLQAIMEQANNTKEVTTTFTEPTAPGTDATEEEQAEYEEALAKYAAQEAAKKRYMKRFNIAAERIVTTVEKKQVSVPIGENEIVLDFVFE